jgi:sec-independent protein translocase protein TatB
MDIFGVGSTELVIILLIATVVLGPRRMAQVALEFGKLVRNLRNYYGELTQDLRQELALLAEPDEVSQAPAVTDSPEQAAQPASPGQESQVLSEPGTGSPGPNPGA